jgi:hypothetical protein
MPRKKAADDSNAVLARLLLEDRAKKAEAEQTRETQRQRALDDLHRTEVNAENTRRSIQKRCDHLLGNHRMGVKPRDPKCALHKDYLSDKSVRIYCGKCRIEVHPGDTKEFLFSRDGQNRIVKTPNPCNWGWKEFNEFFYSFENATDLTSRAFRLERVEPETIEDEEARILAQQAG